MLLLPPAYGDAVAQIIEQERPGRDGSRDGPSAGVLFAACRTSTSYSLSAGHAAFYAGPVHAQKYAMRSSGGSGRRCFTVARAWYGRWRSTVPLGVGNRERMIRSGKRS